MANNYYTDLDNDFPNAIDAYEPISDVTDATYELAHKYQAYINQGSNTYGGQYTGFQLAAQLKLDNPALEKMDITAKKLNRMQQMIISLQRFTRSLKLQTVLSLNEPSGKIKQVVGSIWGKITNTLPTGEHKVTLKLKETENSYVDYYPKTTADQVLYLDGHGGTVDGETKLKEEIKKIKDVYHVQTYTDVAQLRISSYKFTDIIKAMPDNTLFIAGYKASSPYVSQNSLPTDNGVIKIVKTTLARTDLEITSVVDNGVKYVHYHAVYNSSNNTISDWHEVSYSGHNHDASYYTKTESNNHYKTINDTIVDGIKVINEKIDNGVNEQKKTDKAQDDEIKNTNDYIKNTIEDKTIAGIQNKLKELDDGKLNDAGAISGNTKIKGILTVSNESTTNDYIELIPAPKSESKPDTPEIKFLTLKSSQVLSFKNAGGKGGDAVDITCDDLAVDRIIGSGFVKTNNKYANKDIIMGVENKVSVRGRSAKLLDEYRPIVASSFDIGSDIRFKQNIKPIELYESNELINKLRPVTYQLISEGENAPFQRGLIAQDVIQVVEEMGLKKQIYKYDKDIDKYTLNYTSFIADLINTTQDLYLELEKKENQLSILEERITKLENLIK